MKLTHSHKKFLAALLFLFLSAAAPFLVARGVVWLGDQLTTYIEQKDFEDKKALMRHWNNKEALDEDVRRRLEAMQVRTYPIAGAGADTK